MPRSTREMNQPAKNQNTDDLNEDLKSVSEVDRDPRNGGERRTDWRDERAVKAKGAKPTLEDGAD